MHMSSAFYHALMRDIMKFFFQRLTVILLIIRLFNTSKQIFNNSQSTLSTFNR